MLISPVQIDSNRPPRTPYQPYRHLLAPQHRRASGLSVFQALYDNSQSSRFSRLPGGDYRSMGKGYKDYYAKSPGQPPNATSQAKSTGNDSRASGSSSPRAGKGSPAVDSSGKPKPSSPGSIGSTATLTVKTTSARQALANVPLTQPSKLKLRDCGHDSDDATDSSSGSELDSPRSYASSVSSVDSLPETIMERKKRELADRIMARFFTYFSPWLEKNFGVECYDDDDDGGGGASSGGGGGGACRTGSTSGAGGSRFASGSKKRQQRDDSDDGGDDGCASEDDDGNRRRRRDNKRVRRDSGTRRHALRFACPFYKYDKKRYAKHRTCCGPGWIDIHRVKEHIFRKHLAPDNICKRCLTEFEDDDQLDAHQRSDKICERRERDPHDRRLNREQQDRLRVKFTSGMPPPEKWNAMFSILFPGAAVPANPYHEGTASFTELYGEFLRDEFPPAIRRTVEIEIEKRMKVVEVGMVKDLADIVRIVGKEMFDLWLEANSSPGAEHPTKPPPKQPRKEAVGGRAPPSPEPAEPPPRLVEAVQTVGQDVYDLWSELNTQPAGAKQGSAMPHQARKRTDPLSPSPEPVAAPQTTLLDTGFSGEQTLFQDRVLFQPFTTESFNILNIPQQDSWPPISSEAWNPAAMNWANANGPSYGP